MYYPSSENKGADQLRGYREADLRLCFRLGKNPIFSRCGSDHPNLSSVVFLVFLLLSRDGAGTALSVGTGVGWLTAAHSASTYKDYLENSTSKAIDLLSCWSWFDESDDIE